MFPTNPTDPDCGCAPTPAEQKQFRTGLTRRGALAVGIFGAVLFGAGGALATPSPVYAAGQTPSWDDVEKAQQTTAGKNAEVARIQALIAGLERDLARAQATAEKAGEVFHDAQLAYFEAAVAAEDLQLQADRARGRALTTSDTLARVAARQYKDGVPSPLALLGAEDPDEWLYRLGTLSKFSQHTRAVYAGAIADQNTAQSLSDQAKVKRDERDRLQKDAEREMHRAQQAAEEAQAILASLTDELTVLRAQLAALTDTSGKTVTDYKAGVDAEKTARADRERKAREQAAGTAGGGGSAAPAPQPKPKPKPKPQAPAPQKPAPAPQQPAPAPQKPAPAAGWVRPNAGGVTSGFGPRNTQCAPGYCSTSYHYGLDLGGACSSAILAASSGTVVYAGPNGGYGNFVKIDHGSGLATGYAHIENGGIRVSNGQKVNAGDLIATVGNTGNSFGCHLHFEVYKNGSPINPEPFLRARGLL